MRHLHFPRLVKQRDLDLILVSDPLQGFGVPRFRVSECLVKCLDLTAARDDKFGRAKVKMRVQEVPSEL